MGEAFCELAGDVPCSALRVEFHLLLLLNLLADVRTSLQRPTGARGPRPRSPAHAACLQGLRLGQRGPPLSRGGLQSVGFGTTQPWAIWTMTMTGWLLGLLLVGKWAIGWRTGYQPVRWDNVLPAANHGVSARIPRGLTIVLAVLTVLILAYCLVSAWNARASYDPVRRAFTYHECLRWLPHSYDRTSSWFVFAQLLGLAGFFWALRDWLLGLSSGERRAVLGEADQPRPEGGLPVRVKRLLWVLCGQGAVLALVAILNRLAS